MATTARRQMHELSSSSEVSSPRAISHHNVEMEDVQTFLDALASMNKACNSARSLDGKDDGDSLSDSLSDDGGSSPKKRGRKKLPLSEEEKVKKVRERNREHAKKIRLKRKAYVEELKQEAAELVTQQHSSLLKRRKAAENSLQGLVLRFLQLGAGFCADGDKWQQFVTSDVEVVLPYTPRKASPADRSTQVLRGVSRLLQATQQFEEFSQGLARTHGSEGKVSWQVSVSDVCVCGCVVMCEWAVLSTTKTPIRIEGMLECVMDQPPATSDTARVKKAVLVFDPLCIQRQLLEPYTQG